ncbi:unnamed protein product, partial [Brachionus calyciflorus]
MGGDHSDSANLTQLIPVNFSYSDQTVHSQLHPDRQVNLNQISLLSQSNNFIPQGTIRFGTFNTSFTTTGVNNTINNSSLNDKNLTWKDILNPNFDINVLLLNVNSIADEPREVFLNEYKTKLTCNTKSNKQKFETLRCEMFKLLLQKLNYSGQKISLNLDRTGLGFTEDLYNICVSYVEGELKANLLDIFLTESIKNACSNEQISKLCEIGFGQIRGEYQQLSNTLQIVLNELDVYKKQNSMLLSKVSELEKSCVNCKQGLAETELGENSKSFKRRGYDDYVSTSQNFTNNLIPGPSTADETVQDTLEGPDMNTHTNSNESGENARTDSDLKADTASNQAPSTNKP